MTNDVLRFEIGTATEFIAPNGRRYLRASFGGLSFTAYPDPDREPAAGGIARWVVIASPAPGKARHVRVPAREDASPRDVSVKPATKAELLRSAAEDAIARHGAIPTGGDPLPESLAAPASDDIEDTIALLETPVV